MESQKKLSHGAILQVIEEHLWDGEELLPKLDPDEPENSPMRMYQEELNRNRVVTPLVNLIPPKSKAP